MAEVHSFGPSCVLHDDFNEFTRRASGMSDEAPKIKSHFFYSSALPIDDPLSPLPTPSTSYQLGTSKVHPPRPFSAYDNAALEEAWQGLQNHDCQNHHEKFHSHGPFCTDSGRQYDGSSKLHHHGASGQDNGASKDPNGPNINNVANIVKEFKESGSPGVMAGKKANENITGGRDKTSPSAAKPSQPDTMKRIDIADPKHISHVRKGNSSRTVVGPAEPQENLSAGFGGCGDPEHSIHTASPSTISNVGSTRTQGQSDSHLLLSGDPQHGVIDESRPLTADELAVSGDEREPNKKHRNIFRRRSSPKEEKDHASPKRSHSSSRRKAKALGANYGSSPSDRQTTGTPFLRVPSPGHPGMSAQTDGVDAASEDEGKRPRRSVRRFLSDYSDSHKSDSDSGLRSRQNDDHRSFLFGRKEQKAYVPVGLSRLHLVEMPTLEVMTLAVFSEQL